MYDQLLFPVLITPFQEYRLVYANPAAAALGSADHLFSLFPASFTAQEVYLSERWWHVTSQPITYAEQPSRLLSFTDITPYKQQAEHYRRLTEFISDYTYTYRVASDGKLTWEGVSDQFRVITGFSPSEIDPLNQLEQFVHPSDVDVAQQQVQNALEGERTVSDWRFLHKNGDLCWLRHYLAPVHDPITNQITHLYGMGQDVTYRKRAEEALLYGTAQDIAFRKNAEEQLRRYASELEIVNQELDAYSHTIAHDLKSPLSGILGFVELMEYMLKSTEPEKALPFALRIRASAENMVKMINQLLTLARLRNAEETVTKVEMQEVIDVVKLRLQQPIEKMQAEIEVISPLPPVMGHVPWLEEVFANLISNALKYMGDNTQPRVIIEGKIEGDFVRYTVQDNGIGIALGHQARLFEMFTRIDTVKREGTGLGLSIVQRIITKLKGEVGLTSEPGKGSTFWFTLPKGE